MKLIYKLIVLIVLLNAIAINSWGQYTGSVFTKPERELDPKGGTFEIVRVEPFPPFSIVEHPPWLNIIDHSNEQGGVPVLLVNCSANEGTGARGGFIKVTDATGNTDEIEVYQLLKTIVTAPSAPPVPSKEDKCGETILTSNTPPENVTYYWQNTANGTNRNHSQSKLVVTNNGTYYLRAYSNDDLWSETSSSVTVTIKNFPDNYTLSPVSESNPRPFLNSSQTGVSYQLMNSYEEIGSPLNGTGGAIQWTGDYADGIYTVRANNSDGCYSEMDGTIILGEAMTYIHLTSNKRYVASRDYQKAIKSVSEIQSADDILANVTYYDGLSRPDQVIQMGASPGGYDMVQPIDYNQYGQEQKKYLPYVLNKANQGAYIETELAVSNWTGHHGAVQDDFAFAETEFEASPLNRVLKQGAPGSEWQIGNNHTIRFDYQSNSAEDVLLLQVINGQLSNTGGEVIGDRSYYPAKKLVKTVTKDENWSSGQLHTTEEYKNFQGQVVLKRTYVNQSGTITPVETYYVYDDYGLLRYVLPPEAVKHLYGEGSSSPKSFKLIAQDKTLNQQESGVSEYMINQGSSLTLGPGFVFNSATDGKLTITTGNASADLIYAYEYDGLNRMVEKALPGATTIYMVYDNRDRLVATQDGEMRKNGEWLFTKYDKLNRPIATGIVDNNITEQSAMQTVVDNFYANTNNKEFEERGSIVHGYSDNSYPKNVSANGYLSITYYDDYEWTGSSDQSTYFNDLLAEFNNHGLTGATLPTISYYNKLRGLVTGTKTKVLDSQNTWLTAVTYYDDKLRPVLAQSDNYVGGEDVVLTSYDFVGKVMETWQCHKTSLSTQNKRIIRQKNDYDHAGRLLTIKQQMTGAVNLVTIAKNEYNELGELITKKVGGDANPVQQMDYKYNIRGWLTQINNPDDVTTNAKKKFGMKLHYNDAVANLTNSVQYNGNISAIEWQSPANSSIGSPGRKQAYGFSYDGLNRLIEADYGEGTNFTTNIDQYNVIIGEKDVHGNIHNSYDLNGNINKLSRKKAGSLIDDLTYAYTGNQLLSVDDKSNGTDGFREGSTNTYSYDLNGNMVKDNNKGLKTVEYNYLNLPKKLTGTDNKTIEYIYSANGQKLVKIAPNGTETYYAGGFVYEGSSLKYVLHPEGMVNTDGTTDYVYHIKDHLGNTRLSVNSGGSIVDQADYYPFGMLMTKKLSGGVNNKYKYNGKELQDDKINNIELDWYDYGARFYDASLGRWHVNDPLSEKYESFSPYTYVLNNPINAIDPDGKLVVFVNGLIFDRAMAWKTHGVYDGDYIKHYAYPPPRNIYTSGEPLMFKSRLDYWGNIDDRIGDIYKDHNFAYINATDDFHSKAIDRFAQGEKSGLNLIKRIKKGKVKLGEGETIKVVGHSQGAAFAAGMLSVLVESEYSSLVEAGIYISPHQPGDFEHPNSVLGLQFSTVTDQVSSKYGMKGWILNAFFNGGSELDAIKGSDMLFLRMEHDEEHKGHGVQTWQEIFDTINNFLN